MDLALRGETPDDRLRALAWFWDRLDGVPPTSLGEAGGSDLIVLVVAGDPAGVAVSAVGLGHLYGTLEGYLRAWIVAPHPLLSAPGKPTERPGALQVQRAPAILVGAASGAPNLEHERVEPVLPWCGVHP